MRAHFQNGSSFCLNRCSALKALDRTMGLNRALKASGGAPTPKTIGSFLLAPPPRRSSLVDRVATRSPTLSPFVPARRFEGLSKAPLSTKHTNSPTLPAHGDGVERRQSYGLLGGLLLPAPAVLRPFPLLLRRRRRLASLSSSGRRRARRGRAGARRDVILLLAAAAVVVVGRGRGDDEEGAARGGGARRRRRASDSSSALRRRRRSPSSCWPRRCRGGGRARDEGVLHC